MPAENIPTLHYLVAAAAVCSPIAMPIVAALLYRADKRDRLRRDREENAERARARARADSEFYLSSPR